MRQGDPGVRGVEGGPAGYETGEEEPRLEMPRPLFARLTQVIASAWMASILLHIVLLIMAALITVGGAQAGGASEEGESIGIAVMTEAEFGQLADASLTAADPTASAALEDPLAVDVRLQIPEALAAFDQSLDLSSAATSLISGLGAGDLSGSEMGGAGGGGGAASFFGVEAKGTRFVYIVDISGSMDIPVTGMNLTRIEVLRRQLQSSIANLNENSRFMVVLFNHEARPMGGRLDWTTANEAGKQWARNAISEITAQGGTDPLPGFRMTFALRPRPEAIYFMTDGEFHFDAPRQIALMNSDTRIPIHCICFDSTEGEALMTKIAEESNGSYHYVTGAPR